jgi:hypothetical protein
MSIQPVAHHEAAPPQPLPPNSARHGRGSRRSSLQLLLGAWAENPIVDGPIDGRSWDSIAK